MVGGNERGTRAVAVGVAACALGAAACLVAADVTGSASVEATGVLAAGAAVHLLLVLLGVRRSRSAPDGPEVGGHGREHHYWPFVLGAAGFTAAAAVGTSRGVDVISAPGTVGDLPWAAAALGAAAAGALIALRTAARAADDVRGRAGWWGFVRRARSPELPVVLVEVVALLVAVVAAGASLVVARATDDAGADGVGAVAVGAVAAVLAAALVAGVRELLIGRSGTRREVEVLEAALQVDPSVQRLLLLRTQHVGPDDLLVTAKLQLDHQLSLPEVAEVLQRIERHVRVSVPTVRTVFLEPDVAVERRAAPVVVDEHEPGHEIPTEARARLEAERRRGSLGEGIPLEEGLDPAEEPGTRDAAGDADPAAG